MDHREPVSFFEHLDEVRQALSGKDVLLFLDYDGTLTPIVDTPDKAIISDAMRDKVRNAASVLTTSIVSGRATDDVRGKARLEGVFYAGSHGFEIRDPQGQVTIQEDARKFRPIIDEVHAKLAGRLKDVPGALVENVKFTISAHYRLVPEEHFPAVKKAVDDILAEYPNLRKTDGKKVFEIRPRIEWDKGKAVAWILNVLKFDPGKHVPVYIGDDTTDEDAFKFLGDKGIGIFVAEKLRPSAARYVIADTDAVGKVLDFFVSLKQGEA